MKLRLEIENASPEERERGIEAAEAVFATAGISAEQAAYGCLRWRAGMMPALPQMKNPPRKRTEQLSGRANKAAIAACCADWPADVVPGNRLLLELVD